MLKLVSVLASLALTASLASAQPSVTPIAPAPAPPADHRELSPETALALSLGVTAAGYGAAFAANARDGDNDGLVLLAVAGIGLGPSAGHWYQEDFWTRGLGLRLVGASVGVIGIVSTIQICFEDCPEQDNTLGHTMMLLGGAAFAYGTLEDIVRAPISADRRNRERAIQRVTLAPHVSGDRAGLVLGGTF